MASKREIQLEKCLEKTLKDISDYASDSLTFHDCQDIPRVVVVRIKNRITRTLRKGK